MPEGPEVYRIAQRMKDVLKSATLQSLEIVPTPQQAVNSRVHQILTKGNRLVIALEDGRSILITFALTGKIEYEDHDTSPHTVAILTFNKTLRIVLRDQQKLASAILDDNRAILTLLPAGFDPLHTITGMCEWLAICQAHSRQLVANFLTNQNIVTGVGNRYRSEIMHVSRVPPDSRIRDLTTDQLQILLVNIYRVLKCAARGEYVYTVFGRKESYPGSQPVTRVEVAKGVLIWTTARSSTRRVSKPEAGVDKKAFGESHLTMDQMSESTDGTEGSESEQMSASPCRTARR